MTDLATSSRATTGAGAHGASSPTQRSRADHGADAPRHGFRPSARRRTRMAAGVALGAVAIALNLVVYTGLDRRAPVVQVVRDVPAGELISAADLRTVDVDVDDSVPVVRTTSDVVGHYAAVRLVAGSLVTAASLRPAPLVTPGAAVVGIRVPEGALPAGLRERVPVQLVVPPDPSTADGLPRTVTGRVVGLPTTSESALGTVSLSVEVPADRAAVVAAADDVRVVLVEPTPDPAVREPSG